MGGKDEEHLSRSIDSISDNECDPSDEESDLFKFDEDTESEHDDVLETLHEDVRGGADWCQLFS